MTVYLVTADLYKDMYGAEIHCIGIFTDKEYAERCAGESFSPCFITEVEVDKPYYAITDIKKGYKIDLTKAPYLGGYIE